MNENDHETATEHNAAESRHSDRRRRRFAAIVLPLVLLAVLAVALINGPVTPDRLAFNDGTPASDSDGVDAGGDAGEVDDVREEAVGNQPPFALDDLAATTPNDVSVIIAVLDNDTDPDVDPDTDSDANPDFASLYIHTAEVVSGRGDVRIVSSGAQLLFTPERGAVGPWTVSYVVTDGAEGFDQAEVTITDGNSAPTAINDSATTTTQSVQLIDVRSNDVDDDAVSELTVASALIAEPANTDAIVEIADVAQLEFTAPSVPGTVIIEYTVEDRHGRSSSARLVVEVAPSVPVAVDDTATTPEDTAIVVDVLANDGPAEIDLDESTLRILTSSSGIASLTNGGIRYEPPPDAVGKAQITYEICAVSTACDTASLFIDVTPVTDQSPFAAEGQLQIPSDAGPQVIPWIVVSSGQTAVTADMIFAIDTDRPELFSDAPSISSEGILTFEPRVDTAGTANTTITVRDSAGTRTFRLALIIG